MLGIASPGWNNRARTFASLRMTIRRDTISGHCAREVREIAACSSFLVSPGHQSDCGESALRHVACLTARGAIPRLQRRCLIEMDEDIELLGEPGVEISRES